MTSTAEQRPTELEIKFQLPAGQDPLLAAHPILATAWPTRPPERREFTTYFDSASHDFAHAGASLRVRRRGGRHVQTLKLRDGASPFGRGEWEWPVPGPRPEPAHLAETPLAGLAAQAGPLGAVFTSTVTRSIRTLRHEGALIEVTTDLGTLRTEGPDPREVPIREMELELKEGPPAALFRLAERLQAELALCLGAEAKSDRGWRLLTGQPRPVEKQVDPDFPPDATAAEAFRRIAGTTLATLLANQPAAMAGVMEGVHQMRVSIRRLRASLALFRPHLAEEPEARFTEALRDLGRVLGEARDWDVFCTETLPRLTGEALPTALADRLLPLAETRRADAHQRLRAALEEPAVSRTILGLAAWAEDPAALSGEAEGGAMAEPLEDLAEELEEALLRRVKRRGRRIRRRSDEELHALRKALKKLRYGLEFLAPLHRKKRLQAYLHRCKAMQEQLGAMNDAAMAVSLVHQLAAQDAALTAAIGPLEQWAGAQRAEALARLPKAWRAFRHAALPRIRAG